MKIGKYELRKPWVKYVDVPIEEEIYWAVRKSIGEDIAKEIAHDFDGDCNGCYCDGLSKAIDIAKGQV